MSRAGFVLAGGKSTRMGRDKALLPVGGIALASHVAAAVEAAAGSVALVGDPAKYAHLGYPVVPDHIPGNGPLGGIETALSHSAAEWNLVVACDMPGIDAGFLRSLFAAAENLGVDVLMPAGPSGRPEPLSAIYHRRCAASIRGALDEGVRKVTDALAVLTVRVWTVVDSACFENLNTPQEWAHYNHDAH